MINHSENLRMALFSTASLGLLLLGQIQSVAAMDTNSQKISNNPVPTSTAFPLEDLTYWEGDYCNGPCRFDSVTSREAGAIIDEDHSQSCPPELARDIKKLTNVKIGANPWPITFQSFHELKNGTCKTTHK